MKNTRFDLRIVIGIIIAHILIYFTFQDKNIFWHMFTASMLILISYSIFNEKADSQSSYIQNFIYGVLSGFLLFTLFWLGDYIIDFFHMPFKKEITALYKYYSPSNFWHYLTLLFIIVPGEEIFWRGFIQKKLASKVSLPLSITLATLAYASVQLYSGYYIHMVAALVGGIYWGILYAWKKNITLNIISHVVFDFCLFILFPLR
ncbi:lysostaphin resistance A-like protein [Niallia sp. Krafla_26]|uniref:CPBP family intramembrane glutamic endopeptidase n=1 Tax=Niallia sp. Krafla_26 TaxID=3064703 RepID=UPI003D168826